MIRLALILGVLLVGVAGGIFYARTTHGEGFDFLPFLGLLFDVMAKVDWLNFLLIATGFVILILLLVAQFRKGDGFDLRSMFAGRTNGPCGDLWTVEPGRVFQTTAFLITTWGFVHVTVRDKLTEIYLLVYVVLWAGSRAMNQIVASKFPVQPGTNLESPPPASPQVVTTTTTEVKP